jgi:transcriptional regulator with XRE-family HTH domain
LRENNYTVQELCEYLGVSVSGYYKFKNIQDVNKDIELSKRILEIYNDNDGVSQVLNIV